jgi:superfamily II DNA or RNA helicase
LILELHFDKGSLILKTSDTTTFDPIHPWIWDERSEHHRTLAYEYPRVLKQISVHQGVDRAKCFEQHQWEWCDDRELRPSQCEALEAWRRSKGRGVVVLPTGAGKSLLAMKAIHKTSRTTLVIVPTLDLMAQWMNDMERVFSSQIGQMGGGVHDIRDITVSTYDSAHLHMEHVGHRFGMLVFDECHHLPSSSYQWIAKMSIAPFRLGLSATPERHDGSDAHLSDLIGEEVYRAKVQELRGNYLSEYETITMEIEMDSDERQLFQSERAIYTNFIKEEQVDMSHPSGWSQFLQVCFRSPEGKRAYQAYLTQKKLAKGSRAKLKRLQELLFLHRKEQVLVFTDDNETAYRIGEYFCLPVITHHTKMRERKAFLKAFKEKVYPFLITSKVLNEGVDLPAVKVAVIVSGSASVREHVQRLGRVLRKQGDQVARLYEMISKESGEHWQSRRRRQHEAYKQR